MQSFLPATANVLINKHIEPSLLVLSADWDGALLTLTEISFTYKPAHEAFVIRKDKLWPAQMRAKTE